MTILYLNEKTQKISFVISLYSNLKHKQNKQQLYKWCKWQILRCAVYCNNIFKWNNFIVI